MFEVNSWGKKYYVRIVKSAYCQNGGLALPMFVEETYEPFATLTVNLSENLKLPENMAYVDTNNCPWAEEFIAKYELGKPTGQTAQSGWCTYPLYVFDLGKLE